MQSVNFAPQYIHILYLFENYKCVMKYSYDPSSSSADVNNTCGRL